LRRFDLTSAIGVPRRSFLARTQDTERGKGAQRLADDGLVSGTPLALKKPFIAPAAAPKKNLKITLS
jgi:hypothetical protein